jgi:hypothetical protein
MVMRAAVLVTDWVRAAVEPEELVAPPVVGVLVAVRPLVLVCDAVCEVVCEAVCRAAASACWA